MIDGIRWRTRTGARWRDVPERYGPWDRIYALFRRWQRDGTWARLVTQPQTQADAKGLITWDVNVDSTVCRAHQYAAGASKRGPSRPVSEGIHRSSSRSWRRSGCPASVLAGPAAGRTGCEPTRRTTPAATGPTCADAVSRQLSRSRLTGSAPPETRLSVLLSGHTRLHRGRSWPGAAAGLLARQGREPFASIDQPELFGAPAYSWDRLIRRDLWIRQELAFPDGLHEEVTVVHRAMLAADRVAVLKWNCVQIRRRHTQHPAGSPDGTHFDVFGRYEESFDLLEERDALDVVAPFLFTRMIRHYLFLLNLEGCLSRSERPQFFERASEHYRRFLPDGYEHPESREGVKFQLVASGRYSALKAANLPQRARSFVSQGAAVRGR